MSKNNSNYYKYIVCKLFILTEYGDKQLAPKRQLGISTFEPVKSHIFLAQSEESLSP
jgi:hypothetical protein